MEIKRKLRISEATSRRFIVRESRSVEQMSCGECGAVMLTAERAANFSGVGQRRIFRLIEEDAMHFTETEAGGMMICLSSLAEVFENRSAQNQRRLTER